MKRSLKALQESIHSDKEPQQFDGPAKVVYFIKDAYTEKEPDSKGKEREWLFIEFHRINEGKASELVKFRKLWGTPESKLIVSAVAEGGLGKKYEVTMEEVMNEKAKKAFLQWTKVELVDDDS